MTPEQVLATHRGGFDRALLERDWDYLASLYANEYMLVRSDGSIFIQGRGARRFTCPEPCLRKH